jgi:penicillin-binding protein 2
MNQQPFGGEFGSMSRQRFMSWLVIAVSAVFIGRLGWLQIVEGGAYRLRAEAQAIKQIKIEPLRGMMIDRNGKVIVQNAPGFSITVTPYQFTREAAARLGLILGIPDSVVLADVQRAAAFNRFNPVKISVGRDVDFGIMSAIEEARELLPGVDVIVDPKRAYNFDGNAAHLLGYTREVSEWQLKELGDAYDPGDITGQTGLEKAYEVYVRGQKGLQFVAVNNRGQRVSSFNDGKSDAPARRGFDLQLGLDIDLQVLAEKMLADKRGAAVAIDPNNGEILAFASKPDYDLRELTGRLSRGYFNQVYSDAEKPLFNRASMPNYPPGSTWKMLVALGCLHEGLITENTTLYCGGSFTYGNKTMACHAAHGSITVVRALQGSCNTFFAQCGMKLGPEGMKKYGDLLGFGHKTQADITEEASGLVPSRAYMDKRYGGPKNWSAFSPANWGIGQGEVLVTPLQMARYAALLANGGILLQPHAVRSMENNVLNRTDVMRYGSMDLGLDSKYLDVVRQGMYKVVNELGGTATSVRIPDVVMCGKTGTAQNPHGKDHSWFVCFAPMDKPVIAICVMVENAGFGSTVAAPIAKAMVELYVKGRWPQGMEPPTKPKPPAQSPDSTGAGEGIPVDSALPKPVEVPEPKGPFMLAGK